MPLTFRSSWLDRADRDHAINNQRAISALFNQSLPSDARNATWTAEVRSAALSKSGEDVEVYAGLHQDKFGSNNSRDQVRIDQAHFNVVYKGAARHVYVQPNLGGKYEITEISGP